MFQTKLEELSPLLKDFIFKKLLDVTSFGLFIFNKNLKIVFWSNSAKKITGYNSSDVVGKKLEDITILELFSKGYENLNIGKFLKNLFDEEKDSVKTIFIRHKKNYRFSITIKFYYFKDRRNMKKYIVGIFNIFDVLDYSRRYISSIKKVSNQDWLTKLPNRKNLEFLINKKVYEFKRYKRKFGIILFDIDNFKPINDCMGHNNVSAGFAVINKGDNLNSLVERADKNMYEFKFKKINP